jgi:hypothetical protein
MFSSMARLLFGLLGLVGLGCGSNEATVINGPPGSAGMAAAVGGSAGAAAAEGGAGGGGGSGGAADEGPKSDVVEVGDGDFTVGSPPVGADAGVVAPSAPQIVSLTGPEAVTNGGSIILQVGVSPPVASPRFVVGLAEDTGYHTVTGADPDGDGIYDIAVQVAAEAPQTSLSFSVALLDADGNAGPYHRLVVELVHSGTGDVKVTLSFDRLHDLDLHVIEPSGDEIYFDRRVTGSGGQLDLDSGSRCDPSPANSENIFWPPGGAPAGLYKVSVQNFQQCSPGPIAFRVRIAYDGVVQVYDGSFDDGTAAEAPSATNVKQIATFERGQ